jgi:hypothetical protein
MTAEQKKSEMQQIEKVLQQQLAASQQAQMGNAVSKQLTNIGLLSPQMADRLMAPQQYSSHSGFPSQTMTPTRAPLMLPSSKNNINQANMGYGASGYNNNLYSNYSGSAQEYCASVPDLLNVTTEVDYDYKQNKLNINGEIQIQPKNGTCKVTVTYDNEEIDTFYAKHKIPFSQQIDFEAPDELNDIILLISYPNMPDTIGWIVVCEM